jgi:mRNA interferase MazF
MVAEVPANSLQRWTAVLVSLDPIRGSEQAGTRPCLIVSNDGFNHYSSLVTVLPITRQRGKDRRAYSFEVALPANAAGNTLDSIVMPQQVRTISKARIVKRLGRLDDVLLRAEIEDCLMDHFGIDFEDDVEV